MSFPFKGPASQHGVIPKMETTSGILNAVRSKWAGLLLTGTGNCSTTFSPNGARHGRAGPDCPGSRPRSLAAKTQTSGGPFAAGFSIDVLACTVAEQLSSRLGVPIILDNKPGGAGIIGTADAAKATPMATR